jgi:hypothetical protein
MPKKKKSAFDGMIKASFKHPKIRKLVYNDYLNEKDIPKEIIHNGKTYLLYGVH